MGGVDDDTQQELLRWLPQRSPLSPAHRCAVVGNRWVMHSLAISDHPSTAAIVEDTLAVAIADDTKGIECELLMGVVAGFSGEAD